MIAAPSGIQGGLRKGWGYIAGRWSRARGTNTPAGDIEQGHAAV
jgi:hypothetical protein